MGSHWGCTAKVSFPYRCSVSFTRRTSVLPTFPPDIPSWYTRWAVMKLVLLDCHILSINIHEFNQSVLFLIWIWRFKFSIWSLSQKKWCNYYDVSLLTDSDSLQSKSWEKWLVGGLFSAEYLPIPTISFSTILRGETVLAVACFPKSVPHSFNGDMFSFSERAESIISHPSTGEAYW